MASSFERAAIARLVERAESLGVEVPAAVSSLCTQGTGNHGALLWANAHPGEQPPTCCYGSMYDAEGCTCWRPVYDVEQAAPRPLNGPQDLAVRAAPCGDCAYRKGSPERTDEWREDLLLALPGKGEPFFCHDGMRRPVRWEHPDGRTVPGDPDDWHPAMAGRIPYRADGSPGLLCAGWAARAAREVGT